MHLLFFNARALQRCLGTNTHPFQTIHATIHATIRATIHQAMLVSEFAPP
jgi:hypothetical protein